MSPRELALAQAALRKLPAPPPKPKIRKPVTRRPYGSLPVGVSREPHGGYTVQFRRKSGSVYLGSFRTLEEATEVAARYDAENPALLVLIPWSPDDERRLRDLAGRMPASGIASQLGRSLHAVYNHARKLGIPLRALRSRYRKNA